MEPNQKKKKSPKSAGSEDSDANREPAEKHKSKKRGNKKANKIKRQTEDTDSCTTTGKTNVNDHAQIQNPKKAKRKKDKKASVVVEDLSSENMVKSVFEDKTHAPKEKKNGKKRKKKSVDDESDLPKKKRKQESVQSVKSNSINKSLDGMDSWKDLYVPNEVLWALRDLGFKEPTPIQAQVLQSAIRDKMDIVGAAETGSGKTLAFGIPVLHFVMEEIKAQKEGLSDSLDDSGNETGDVDDDEEDKGSESENKVKLYNNIEEKTIEDVDDEDEEKDKEGEEDKNKNESESNASDSDNDEEENMEADGKDIGDTAEGNEDRESSSEEELEELEEGAIGCVKVIKDVDFSWMDSDPSEPAQQITDKPRRTYPRALILEPTRELAIQVKNHLIAASKYTDVKIAAIVGGLSLEKQRRILRRCPDVLVATPGRLWELVQEGEVFLSEVEKTRYVVIDEADRMIEKGHFEELAKLLERMKKSGHTDKRQLFVFSATLTMVHSGPQRVLQKRKKKLDEKQKLVYLMRKMGLRPKPKIVDITRKLGTVLTLTEARINCTKEEKDIYLYYFLKQYPGRTLVFTNSKDCIRRLISIFSLLQCQPLPLHADMHQRQRLKNLDRFTANPNGVLMASDVAARGLDIPHVQHVIHYQVPHTVENYVHRSGRTARAQREGLSVMLVGPDDVKNYRKIIHTLNKSEELPLFPVEQECLPEIRRRVNLIRDMETQEYRFNKKKRQNDWFIKAAEEAGVEIEDQGLLDDMGGDVEQMRHKQYIKHMKKELSVLLKQPVMSRSTFSKYPTKTGKLVSAPTKENQSDALESVKKAKKEDKTADTTTSDSQPPQELSRSQKRRQLRREKWKQLKMKKSQETSVD